MYMLDWEEAKVLSGYMVSLPIVRKDKWATHFDAVGGVGNVFVVLRC